MLTDFNGTAITYDEIGNPLTMGSKTLTWNCRTLQSITDGENTYSYKYNGDGQRISKTVNGVETEYYYNGRTLAGQKQGDNTLAFMYDNDGNAFAFNYNGNEYFYVKNAQNDVTGIIDSSTRTVIAEYHYDAWGNVISITDADGNEITDSNHIAHINPLRYRSYYYDTETNLYYLNSRYYSPEMCRFLNADGYVQTGQGLLDKNMFAYCLNNPIIFSDYGGTISTLVFLLSVGGIIFLGWLIDECTNKTDEPTTIGVDDLVSAVVETISPVTGAAISSVNVVNTSNKINNQLRKHSENMVNASYAKINKIPFSATNISPIVFPSDEAYTTYCLNKVKSFNDFLVGSERDLLGKRWDDLSSEDQEYIISFAFTWDPDTVHSINTNNSLVGGFSAYPFINN